MTLDDSTGRAGEAQKPLYLIGDEALRLEDVADLARGQGRAELAPAANARMQASFELLRRLHEGSEEIYGVTTSVGASVDTHVPAAQAAELSLNLLRMHGCGTGRILDEDEAAAVVLLRVVSLAQGRSGVRPLLAERLLELFNARVLPRIPAEGSVGASGDLTPLSYVAALLVGEREVTARGRVCAASEALAELGLEPLVLEPKEALSLMNGTSVASALACLAWSRARRLSRLASAASAMASHATLGNPSHFDALIHEAKAHPGQMQVAQWIREDLQGLPTQKAQRLQDRYSIRCAPQVIGVLEDGLSFGRLVLERELNGVSDNPIVAVERDAILHGGNFYGGHVAFVCDALKTAVANVACLLDRQIMLICNPAENGGLPANLVGVEGPQACTHNGFKAVTIAASSLAAEALKLTLPASAFSRSTELHNQDKVPMATLAARDLLRVVEISEQVAAMALLVCAQAYDLRGGALSGPSAALQERVRENVPKLDADRRMDHDIAALLQALRADRLLDPSTYAAAGTGR